MKYYEALFAVEPTLSEDRINTLLSRLEKRIKDNGGEIIKTQKMGIKRLAFTFQRHKRLKEAFYILIEYKGAGKTTEVLMNLLRLQEEVVRHMVTLKEIYPVSLEEEIVPQETVVIGENPSEGTEELKGVEPQ